jgi:Putative beta barrel porin-7 (BBP7)
MFNKWWKRSLALSLGLLVSGARAEENARRFPPGQGRGSPPTSGLPASGPAVTLGTPIAAGPSAASGQASDLAAASLGNPVPLGERPTAGMSDPGKVDAQVRPISFTGSQSDPSQASRQNSGAELLRPIALGSDAGKPSTINPLFTWKQDQDEIAPPPRLESAPPRPTPMGEMFPVPQNVHPFADYGSPVISDGPGLIDGGHCAANEFYVSAEGLVWWLKGNRLPPLATTYPDSAQVPRGALGGQVLLGDRLLGGDAQGGARVMLGYWFDDEHLCGIEGGFLFLGQNNQNRSITSFGGTNLAVPLLQNTAASAPGAYPIAGINPAGSRDVGSVSLATKISLTGGELNWRTNILDCPDGFIDGIVGLRGLSLDEQLAFRTTTSGAGLFSFIPAEKGLLAPAPGSAQRTTNDFFKTQNRFYGGQVGLLGEWHDGCWVYNVNAKIGLGSTQQMVTINGTTVDTMNTGGGSFAYPVGLLAGRTNAGVYTRNKLTFIPEMGASVGYQFTDHLRGFVGYNFMYWSNVVRPADQINRVINPNQLPTFLSGITPGAGNPAQPSFAFHDTSFWAQGITLGLEWRY